MTLAYLDSSVLLSLIFADASSEQAKVLFKTYRWVSSRLLIFECTNVLIRESLNQKNGDILLKKSLKFLEKLTSQINIIPIGSEVLNKILSDKRISKGRTLDAIHLASALYVQDNCEDRLRIASFDKRLLDLSRELGLEGL